jgi:Asp-tRNA(Asn)/Glu-tRNA(Gln) amidotransferase C subunit
MTPDTKCSITKLESLQNKTIDDLKIQLSDVSSQLVEKLNKIEVKNNSMNTQMNAGGKQIRIDVKKYKENAQKILTYSKSMNGRIKNNDSQTLEGFNVLNNNIDYMVSDSNIVSTQGIYSYIIWSIITTVTVIITIELFTNEM